jgi:hypothetical protein
MFPDKSFMDSSNWVETGESSEDEDEQEMNKSDLKKE